jgi:hypothetical protein
MSKHASKPKDKLSDVEKLEYQDISRWSRHDDVMIHRAAYAALPLSFGAVAVAAQLPKMALPLAIFSLFLYCYWLVVATRLSWFSAVRLDRLRELEGKAALSHHSRLAQPPKEHDYKWGAKVSIRAVRFVGLGLLVLAWQITYSHLDESGDKVDSASTKESGEIQLLTTEPSGAGEKAR